MLVSYVGKTSFSAFHISRDRLDIDFLLSHNEPSGVCVDLKTSVTERIMKLCDVEISVSIACNTGASLKFEILVTHIPKTYSTFRLVIFQRNRLDIDLMVSHRRTLGKCFTYRASISAIDVGRRSFGGLRTPPCRISTREHQAGNNLRAT